MLAKLLGYATRLLALKQQTERNTAEIRDLRQEVKTLAEIVRQLQTDLLLSQQKADADKIQQSLQLENALLKIERRLLLQDGSSTTPNKPEPLEE
ncbi:MAG: hypothetical protein AAGE92_06675 [Cyanobacteria bacterium P01_G01_bin.4]